MATNGLLLVCLTLVTSVPIGDTSVDKTTRMGFRLGPNPPHSAAWLGMTSGHPAHPLVGTNRQDLPVLSLESAFQDSGDSDFHSVAPTPNRRVLDGAMTNLSVADALGGFPAGGQTHIRDTRAQNEELFAADNEWNWYLLPQGLMYKSYIAGEKEPRFSTTFLHSQHGETLWDSVLGGRVGLLRYGTLRGIQPEGFQWDLEGGAFLRMQPQTDRDVMSTDYRIGSPLTYRHGAFQYKLGYYHISSHLGDEFLLKNPGYPRLNYSRDAMVLGMGYFPVEELRLYGEVGWAFYTTGGAQPWEVQFGAEWSSPLPTGFRGSPYVAANVHLREEVNWGGSVNILAGWQWRGVTTDHVFRMGLQYFNGANNQYSFLGTNTEFLGYGIRYDY